MNILLTGACGYVGSSLTPYLLSKGHNINAIDIQWFGNYLDEHPNLKLQKKDIREVEESDFADIDAVIHLANIANDPGVELNPTLSWEVNVLATQHLADLANRNGIRQFIYASSGSVYGVKEEEHVTEELSLVPISIYNKTKMVSERVLLSYTDTMKIHNIRPATVCGFSPRMRLDVSVNMLAFQAHKNKKITVFGGEQVRPNIHIEDVVRLIKHITLTKKKFKHNIYNIGFENLSILQIAKKIQKKTGAKIILNKNKDIRSYRQDSSRMLETGFRPKFSVDFAIEQLINYFGNKKNNKFGANNFNLKQMKKLNLK